MCPLESAHSAGSGPRLGEIAGVSDWSHTHQRAYGAATTLYERHPLTQENAGNPIADCFAVVARRNSAILAIADGVNWGEKACVAARSAHPRVCGLPQQGDVQWCGEHHSRHQHHGTSLGITVVILNSTSLLILVLGILFIHNTTTTGANSLPQEVFVALLRSFHAAHNLILQEDGMLTTLTTAVVLPLISSEHYVVCVCNVGDSLAYVYSATHGVREITKVDSTQIQLVKALMFVGDVCAGSHDIHCMRDMRDALGALGPVDGQNPELNNLTCSLTEVENGDIVFLTSDGVSDNFDPVVGKFAVLPPSQSEGEGFRGNTKTREWHTPSGVRTSNSMICWGPSGDSFRPGGVLRSPGDPLNPHNSSLPTVQAYQRHELSLLRMDDLLKHGVSGQGPPVGDAQSLCELLLDFSTRLTAAKRHILEDPDLYYTVNPGSEQVTELSRTEQRTRRKKACEKLVMVPGKLDHATVVAYTVGEYKGGHSPRDGKTNQSDELLLETVL
uniref:PPM-type phosphatase domain-containing protein n=1 Tax=Timema cristinae TaxID=61476 RepID=A0A7R9CQR6_TIMCR|nr:unnamed protein product [Timema cristinae]